MNPENAPKDPAVTANGDAVPGARVFRYAGFEVDVDRGELRVNGRVAALRPKTFALLTYLVEHPGRLLAKDELFKAVWPDVVVTDDSLVQCIRELRSALGDHHQNLVRTVPRRGYILEMPPAGTPAPEGVDRSVGSGSIAPSPREPVKVPKSGLRLVVALLCAVMVLVGAGSWVWWRMSAGHHTTIAVGHRSIAVMPFANLSGDPHQAYFAEGITADVVADVSRLPDTLVIHQAGNQGAPLDPRRIGRDLNVRFVVAGDVWRSGNAVRINVQLLSTESGAVLWADTLDYPDETQWNWRRDVGPRIAHALDIRVTEVVGGWGDEPPEPRDAIEHTMRGFVMMWRALSRSDLENAANEFRQALQTAPDSASAWAGLSAALSNQILRRYISHPQAMMAEAEMAADKALSLDVNNPTAHYAHGQVLILRGRLEAAQVAFETCLTLNPSMAPAHVRMGLIRIELGHAEEAQAHVDIAMRLSPKDPYVVVYGHFMAGIAQFHLGHDDEAYAEFEKVVAFNPKVGLAYQWMAAIDGYHGRTAKAHEDLERYRQLIPIQTIRGLRATERSRNPVFLAQRERFYEGLRKAGMPE